MPAGILEELFIENDLAGTPQVWFRNYSVTASLGLAGNWGTETPALVAWGVNHDHFVVETQDAFGRFTFYTFSMARALNTVFDPGVIPSAILVRIETPFLSTLALATVNVNITTKLETPTIHGTTTQPITLACAFGANSPVVDDTQTDSVVDTGTKAYAHTLTTILATGSIYWFGLNADNELLLMVANQIPGLGTFTGNRHKVVWAATPPCSAPLVSTTTDTPQVVGTATRSETHLWFVNFTIGTVLYRTIQPSGTVTTLSHTLNLLPVLTAPELIHETGGVPACPPIDQCSTIGNPGVESGVYVVGLGVVSQDGPEVQLDSLWAPASFIIGNQFAPTFVDTAQGPSALGTNGSTLAWTKRTWTLNAASTYDVEDAKVTQLSTPQEWVMVVARTNTATGVTRALIRATLTGNKFQVLSNFATGAIKILTANKRFVMWTRGTSAYLTGAFRGISGHTVRIGTNTQAITAKFRLLDAVGQGPLFDAKETIRIEPAGFFADAYEIDDTPTLSIAADGSMPIRGDLIPFEKLQIIPNGITFPVTPDA